MSTRNISRPIAVGAAAAWLMLTAAQAQGQVAIRVPGASIHFGSPPPRRVVPVVPPGSVRYEHYRERERERPILAAPGPAVAYRNPYRDDYFRRFRPGWRPIVVGSTQYYCYPTLPPGCRPVVVGGTRYYVNDGIYYNPYIYEGQTVYMVVPPPA